MVACITIGESRDQRDTSGSHVIVTKDDLYHMMTLLDDPDDPSPTWSSVGGAAAAPDELRAGDWLRVGDARAG